MLRLLFDDFSTEFLQRTDSTFVDLSLGGMRLYDGSTPGNLFEQMLHVKGKIPNDDQRVQELDEKSKDEAGAEGGDESNQHTSLGIAVGS